MKCSNVVVRKCSPCLCTLSASASIPPPIPTFGRFILEIFKSSCFCSFCYVVQPTHLWLMHHLHKCTNKWRPTANKLYPMIEKRWSYVTVMLKTKHKKTQNSLATGGCFECNTYRITALGWLKKERKKMNNSEFRLFQVCHFKIVTTHCYYYCRPGQTL